MPTLLERFIPEAREHLETAATGLLKLEQNPSDELLVNEVFRAVHTLKGASGLFDVPGLTRLVHAGEDLLDAVRSSLITFTPDIVDALLDALDRVSSWVDALERQGRLPDDADGVSVEFANRLRAWLPNVDVTPAADTQAAPVPLDWLAELPEADRTEAFAEIVAGGAPLFAISYTPDEGCFYRGEDPFNLFPQLPGLRALRVFFREPPATLSETDPFHCGLAFRALVAQPRVEIEHLFRYVIEQVAIAAVAPEALIIPAGPADGEAADPEFLEDARRLLTARDYPGLRTAIEAWRGMSAGRAWPLSISHWLDAVLAAPLPNATWALALLDCLATGLVQPIGPPATTEISAPAVVTASGTALDLTPEKPMAARILAEQRRIIAMAEAAGPPARRVAAVEATVSHLLASLGWSLRAGELASAAAEAARGVPARLLGLITVLENRVEAAVASPAPIPPSATALLAAAADQPAPAEGTQHARVLKVDQAKVDTLMNLIAELVVTKNGLPFLARRAEEVHGSRDMGREIKAQYAVIDHLAQEMQRAIMDVRMLPVSDVFERFPRLVRDLARRLNKRIELKIVGEETAADKTIIEALGDPLLHLVRNAIDHGIESPEQRLAAGKPEAATIQLKAFQERDQVVIEVSDDGSGIDPMAVRLRAFEKGMIAEDKVDVLSDQEAINLIFLPGFSTSEEISDLSGRGVGLDVVRAAVEKFSGQLMLSSHKGEGTLVRLSLPLSMAVARVMLVEIGDALFGVPMDGVAETVRVPRSRIHRVKRSEAFILRDAVVPLFRMHTLLGVPRDEVEVDEEAVLVARIGGGLAGVIVDRLREGIDVILKPLEGVLAGIRGYSGSALLGDGRVLLILNLKELL